MKSCYGCKYVDQSITKEPCYRCERVLTESGNYEDCYVRECLCDSCKYSVITSNRVIGCNIFNTIVGQIVHCKFFTKKGSNL